MKKNNITNVQQTKLKKWNLLEKKDVSPSSWFPIEFRKYQLPNGTIIDDFSITTLADVAMIIPITKEGNIVFVRQYKPGYGDFLLEFPAGRIEPTHKNIEETAFHELEEETGIKANKLTYIGHFSGFVTKATEKVFCYVAHDVVFNSEQKLDVTEEIEIVILTPDEVEQLLAENKIPAAITVAAWDLVKRSGLLL